ncbi:MAG TPA: hypothetical protein VM307_00565 [Egibacteraceae bacterium]|nr:hypothetical protein [Egibacteraceae bacterium]
MTQQWEGGRSQGLAWRRLGTVALAAAVLGLGVWSALRDQGLTVERDHDLVETVTEGPQTVVEPPRATGDRWYCSNATPVAAYPDGRYYPTHYPPGERFHVRPQACYADTARAEADGFRLADPPEGVVAAGGLYVVDAHAPTLQQCRDVARDAGFAVPCPRRLPSPGYGPVCGPGRCRYLDGVVIEARGFPLPPEWCTDCDAHVVVTAVPLLGPSELRPCHDQMRLVPWARRPDPERWRVCSASERQWLGAFGGFPHEGHVVVTWHNDGVVYAVSIEGDGEQQAEALAAIIDGLVMVDG